MRERWKSYDEGIADERLRGKWSQRSKVMIALIE